MSDKLNLQKALDALAKAKREDIKAIDKAEESIRQLRQEAEEQSSRQS
ncbi:unnamed protein product [marine sediment metagenome]|uniref:Uncharacterized protein n=1 Tax=marine sediment metagenome TaxID=412755 RepID=X1LLV7_9ZZZZ